MMQVYENARTGEIVFGEEYTRQLHFAHVDAVKWFNDGDNVNIYKAGKNLENPVLTGTWER